MNATLILKTSSDIERRFPVSSDDRMVIGRDQRCDVRVALPSVAPQHCEIRRTERGLEVIDLDSELGTYRNGRPVSRAELLSDDELQIGPAVFRVQIEVAGRIGPKQHANGTAPEIDVLARPDNAAAGSPQHREAAE